MRIGMYNLMRETRLEKQMTLKKLEELTSIHRKELSDIERQSIKTSDENLIKIANALNYTDIEQWLYSFEYAPIKYDKIEITEKILKHMYIPKFI